MARHDDSCTALVKDVDEEAPQLPSLAAGLCMRTHMLLQCYIDIQWPLVVHRLRFRSVPLSCDDGKEE